MPSGRRCGAYCNSRRLIFEIVGPIGEGPLRDRKTRWGRGFRLRINSSIIAVIIMLGVWLARTLGWGSDKGNIARWR